MDPTAEALGTLASQGILGVICVILLVAVWRLFNQNQALNRDRVNDAKDTTKVQTEVVKEHTQTVERFTTAINALNEKIDRLERR